MAHSMILDHRGRPLRRRPIVGTEYAGIEAGRDVTRGYVDDQLYLTPQDKVLRYQGGTHYELYEDMLQDDRVKSAFGQRRAAVVAREWAVEAGGERRRDRMAADHLRETLKHVQWDRVTDLMLYGVFYGYSVAEVLWTRDGRHVAMDRIRVRNRRRFVFDAHFAPPAAHRRPPERRAAAGAEVLELQRRRRQRRRALRPGPRALPLLAHLVQEEPDPLLAAVPREVRDAHPHRGVLARRGQAQGPGARARRPRRFRARRPGRRGAEVPRGHALRLGGLRRLPP